MFLLDPGSFGGCLLCITQTFGRKMMFILTFFVMLFRAGNIPHRKLTRLQIARPYLSPPSRPFYLETRPAQQNTLGGGIKYVFVHSYLGKIPMLRVAYFFNGLVETINEIQELGETDDELILESF